eukprot:105453-Ditylum_brightwellii.AAC.1
MSMDQPINVYFTKIDDIIQYAADVKTPYTAQQIVTAAENAVRKTGMYKKPLQRWREKPMTDKHGQTSRPFLLTSTTYSKKMRIILNKAQATIKQMQ